MTGWRLGYGVMPHWLATAVNQLTVNCNSCTASFTQRAGMAALEGPQDAVNTMVAEFRRRRDAIVKGLNEIPGSLRIAGGAPSSRMSPERACLQKSWPISFERSRCRLPVGTAFGQYGDGYLRFSYANSLPNILDAIERIRKASGKWR
jgi:aspartate/methionine/tyrosine aminotransferase